LPKGKNTQPTMKTFAQRSLDQIIGEISARISTRAYGFHPQACRQLGVIDNQAASR
jgi:hypothetical protein